MDSKKTAAFVKREWHENVIPSLMDFIRVPNVSPSFDAAWATNGLQEQAFDLVTKWAEAQNLAGCKIELLKDTGRTPLLFLEVEANESDRVHALRAHRQAAADGKRSGARRARSNPPSARASCTAAARSTTDMASTARLRQSRPSRRRACRARAS